MHFQVYPQEFSVSKVSAGTPLPSGICFFARTNDENSLVCETSQKPAAILACEDGWRMFRVAGDLDFSLIGILAHITKVLARESISVFCVSTYNTDHVMVKKDKLKKAMDALISQGHTAEYI